MERPTNNETLKDLTVLEAIEENPNISQRDIARRMGTALGVANACIQSLVKKGMIKIRGENNRSITYHLTKRGLLHKSKLALTWTRNTINFYRDARNKIALRLEEIHDSGVTQVILIGDPDLMELTAIVAADSRIQINGQIDINRLDQKNRFSDESNAPDSLRVTTDLAGINEIIMAEVDAMIVCSEKGNGLSGKIKKLLNTEIDTIPLF